MGATLLDGARIAAEIRGEVAAGVREIQARHDVTPGLAVVLTGDDPASAVYVRNKGRACQEAGMASGTFILPQETTQQELLALLERLNRDDRYHGILVQLPLPSHIDEEQAVRALDPRQGRGWPAPGEHGPPGAGVAPVPALHAGWDPATPPSQRLPAGWQARGHLREEHHRGQAPGPPPGPEAGRGQRHGDGLPHGHVGPGRRHSPGGHPGGRYGPPQHGHGGDGQAGRRGGRRGDQPRGRPVEEARVSPCRRRGIRRRVRGGGCGLPRCPAAWAP